MNDIYSKPKPVLMKIKENILLKFKLYDYVKTVFTHKSGELQTSVIQ